MNKLSITGLAGAARHGPLVATDEGRLLYDARRAGYSCRSTGQYLTGTVRAKRPFPIRNVDRGVSPPRSR